MRYKWEYKNSTGEVSAADYRKMRDDIAFRGFAWTEIPDEVQAQEPIPVIEAPEQQQEETLEDLPMVDEPETTIKARRAKK